jgi:hypothetical protein
MAKKKRPLDVNLIAKQIVEEATTEVSPPPEPKPVKEKNPAAVALGRMGGLKGGKARAKSLSPEKRKEIAQQAALKRWKNKPTS